MDKNTRRAIINLIGAREDMVINRLETNPKFQELVKEQFEHVAGIVQALAKG